MKTTLIYTTLTLAAIVIYVVPVMAQPSLPSPPGNAPVDGGLSLLVAAGVGYGAKRIRESRKKNK